MPVPNIPNMPAAPLLDTATFDTVWEDIQRSGELSTPIITEHEANATTRSTLFTCWGLSNIEPDNRILSLLSDTGLSQIFDIDGASWAFELTAATQEPYPTSPLHVHSSVQSPQFISSSPGYPDIYHRLCDAGAPFWVAVSLDIQHCLWSRMSQKLIGREPTKTLFHEVYCEAVARQTSASFPWNAGKRSKTS